MWLHIPKYPTNNGSHSALVSPRATQQSGQRLRTAISPAKVNSVAGCYDVSGYGYPNTTVQVT